MTLTIPSKPSHQIELEIAAFPRPHRFTLEEYHRIAEAGLFHGKRVELLEGNIIDMAPQGSDHYQTIERVADVLANVFGSGFWIRRQGPLRLNDASEPEPDISVVTGKMADYRDHPTTALLVVEVSESTLQFDRSEKAGFYARSGLADYWIVNLVEKQLEVYREPTADSAVASGYKYRDVSIKKAAEFILALGDPQKKVSVADLLPPL